MNRPLLLMSTAVASAFAALLYPILRLISYVLFPDPDPRTIIWSAHAGYFWRVLTALFAMALASILLYVAYGAKPEKLARLLPPLIVLGALAATLQTLFVP